jgi:hypothetical protein
MFVTSLNSRHAHALASCRHLLRPCTDMDCPLVPLMRDCWNDDPARRPIFSVLGERLAAIATQARGTTRWAAIDSGRH